VAPVGRQLFALMLRQSLIGSCRLAGLLLPVRLSNRSPLPCNRGLLGLSRRGKLQSRSLCLTQYPGRMSSIITSNEL